MTITNLPFILDIKDIAKKALPKGRTEFTLFYGLLLFYLSYSLYIAFCSYAIDHKVFETDLYLSFDNPLVLKNGRTNISGHPLMFALCYPLVIIGNILSFLLGYKAKTLLFVLVSNVSISLSCVYVYRYLKEIVELDTKFSMMISMCFAFFFMNLILAFTPESFTFSALVLSFSVYYYSSYIKRDKSPSVFSSIILADVLLGGMTITNMAKGVIPILFLKEKLTTIIKRIVIVGLAFLLILCCVHLVAISFFDKNFFLSIFGHQNTWTPGTDFLSNYAEYIYTQFYSLPIFFSEFRLFGWMNTATDSEQFYMATSLYKYWWQYVVGVVILVFMVLGILCNYKNRYVLMLSLLLFSDVFLHLILRFGLFDPFIYGAHWLYCVPLLMGWMCKSFEKTCINRLLFGTICCMFAALVINNLYEIYNFTTLAVKLFPIE